MANQRLTVVALVYAVIILLLNTLGFFYPTHSTWGFHFSGFLLPIVFIAFIIITVTTVLHIGKRGIPQFIYKAADYMSSRPIYFLIASLGTFVIAAMLLRAATPLLGDGFFLVKNFAETLRGADSIYPRNEPLATFYYFSFMTVLKVVTFQDFMDAFLIADLLLGIVFITCVFYTIRALLTDSLDRFLAFFFLSTLPYMQLFFGYVETYAAILTMLALFTLVSVLCIKRKVPFMLVTVTALIMVLTHYLALLLVPALIYLTWFVWKNEGSKPILKGYGLLVFTFFLLLIITGFNLSQFNESVPYSHFLPLSLSVDPIEAHSEAYTLFSLFHGIDLLNFFILLCAPSILLISLIYFAGERRGFTSTEGRLMLIAFVPVLLFLLIVKFDIGAAKDWDVFAPYTLLLGCLALVVFFPSETDEKKRAFLIVATVTLLHSLTFFVLNASVQPSVKRYESFFNTKTLSNFGFYSSSLGLALYHHQMKNESEVIRIWERYIAHYPADGRGYSNIITNLKNFGTDSVGRIEETFRRWLTANPDDSTAVISYSRFSLDLGNFSFNEGQLENARMFYTRAIYFDQQYARGFNNLGSVYAQEGKFDTAKVLFEKAISIDSNYAEAYYNLGSVYDDMKNRKAAIRNYIKSADLGNTAATEKLKNMETP